MFDQKFYSANRRKLRTAFDGNSLFVFTASGLVQRNGSNTYPFRQDSNFWYLTGLDEPDIILVMDKEGEYIILPERSEIFEKFNGKLDSGQIGGISGVSTVYAYHEGIKKLDSSISKRKEVITVTPTDDHISAAGIYANPSRRKLINFLNELYPNVKLIDARAQLSKQRMIKRQAEINAIEKSIAVSAKAFERIRQNIQNYKSEKEVSNALSSMFINGGADGNAYEPVVASGKHACVLHYSPKDRPLDPRALVLIDAGAELCKYASDLTRTYALSPPSPRQIEIYDAVMRIREYALESLRAGVVFKNYEFSVKKYAHQTIKKLKLKNPDPTAYYPHSTSHFLGLDVHDAGDYETVIRENMVITVEPGIYIEEEGIGIRIEDDFLITADGLRNLSEQLPRELI